MYGLVDAPLLWNLVLISFILDELYGTKSYFDENFI